MDANLDASRTAAIEDLVARVDELQATCARLTEDNADLRAALGAPAPHTTVRTEASSTSGTSVPEREPISRRGLLGKAIGAAAVATAGSAALLARSGSPAAAATGDPVLAGDTVTAPSETIVENSSTSANEAAIAGVISSTSPGGFSSGVRGQNNGTGALGIGVWGSQAGSGWGMFATSASGIGLNASGGSGTGVEASGDIGVSANGATIGVSSAGKTAIVAIGEGPTGIGVSASSGGSQPAIQASNAGSGRGVLSQLTAATNTNGAVVGITAGTGSGVHGNATGNGNGVIGTSDKGTGVLASTTSGVALKVVGKVRFSRSGVATVPGGHSEITVHLPGVSTSSLVLATLRSFVNGVAVAAVVPASGSFKIHLTKAPSTAVKVAWFVID